MNNILFDALLSINNHLQCPATAAKDIPDTERGDQSKLIHFNVGVNRVVIITLNIKKMRYKIITIILKKLVQEK